VCVWQVQDRMLLEGVSVCIFPEGTCHSTVALKELKMGTALMALQVAALSGGKQRVPIVPVCYGFPQKNPAIRLVATLYQP